MIPIPRYKPSKDKAEKVLNEAILQAGKRGWGDVTPTRISAATGIGISWISHHFPGGARTIQTAVSGREMVRLLGAIDAIPSICGLEPRLKAVLFAVLGAHSAPALRALWTLAEPEGWPYSGPVFWRVVEALDPAVGRHSADLAAMWSGAILRHVHSQRDFCVSKLRTAMYRAAVGGLARHKK